MGSQTSVTVFRKLAELSYLASYSHGARYYTLEEIVRFNQDGLWSCDAVWFSSHGTLLSTLERFIDSAEAAIILFFSLLDEKQPRLFAGLESIQFGHGGDTRIAALLRIDPHTVSKGRQQILEQDSLAEGIRKPGAGRPGVIKTPLK